MSKIFFLFIVFGTLSLGVQGQRIILYKNFDKALMQADSLSKLGLYTQSNQLMYSFLKKPITIKELYLCNDRILQNHGIVLNNDSIYHYLQKTKMLLKKGNLEEFSGQSLYREGYFLLTKNKTHEALELFIKSLKVIEKTKNENLIAQNYNCIGNILYTNRNYKESIKYFDKTIQLTRSKNPSGLCGLAHNLKAQSLLALKKYNHAKQEIETAQPLLYHKMDYLLNKILLVKYYNLTKQQLKAFNHSLEAIVLMNEIEGHRNFEKLLTTVDTIQKETDDSILTKVQDFEGSLLKTIHYEIGMKDYLEARETIAQQDNNYKMHVEELKKLLSFKDSIYNLEKEKATEELLVKFQTANKEKDIIALQKSILEKELVISQQRIRKLVFAVTTIIGLTSLSLFILYAKNRKKRMLMQKELDIVKAKQLENDRIGANLHDQNANKLRGIAQQLMKQGNIEAGKKINDIESGLRSLSRELVSIPFEDSSFINQIITLCSKYQDDDFQINIFNLKVIAWKKINTVVKRNLFLVIREGVVNALQHSGANQLNMTFSKKDKNIEVHLEDNGSGLNPNHSSNGIGMRNMKVRINEVRGTINFYSKPNKGTKVHIVLAV